MYNSGLRQTMRRIFANLGQLGLGPWFWLGMGLFVVLGQIYPIDSVDHWYQLFRGHEFWSTWQVPSSTHFVMAHDDYQNFYWVYQAAIAAVESMFGNLGLNLFFGLAWLLVFLPLLKLSGAHRRGLLGGLVALGWLACCLGRFQTRAEVIMFAIMATQFLVLNRLYRSPGPPISRKFLVGVAVLAALQALACNIHGYFVMIPAIALAAGLAKAADGYLTRTPAPNRSGQTAFFVLLCPTLLLASMISPFGYKVFGTVYELMVLQANTQLVRIAEQMPPWHYLQHSIVQLIVVYWFVTAGLWLFAAWRRRLNLFALGMGFSGLVLATMSLRSSPFAMIFTAPLWGYGLRLMWHWARASELRASWKSPPILFGTATFLLCLSLPAGFYYGLESSRQFGVGVASHVFPTVFNKQLGNGKLKGRVFNDTLVGGYLHYHHPEAKLYGKSEYVVSEEIIQYLEGLNDFTIFTEIDAKHDFDRVFLDIGRNQNLVTALVTSTEWQIEYCDLRFVLFRRGSSGTLFEPAQIFPREPYDLAISRNYRSSYAWLRVINQTKSHELAVGLAEYLGYLDARPTTQLANQKLLEIATKLQGVASTIRPGP